jgi:hypothetical protein
MMTGSTPALLQGNKKMKVKKSAKPVKKAYKKSKKGC